MHINNLLKLSYWLDPTVLDERAGALMWLVVLAGLGYAAAGVFVFLKRNANTTHIPRDVAAVQALVGGVVAAVAIGRLFAIAPLGLRAGWLIAAFIAILPFIPRVIVGALRDDVIGDGIGAMVFNRPINRNTVGALVYSNNAIRFQVVREDQPAWRLTTSLLWIGLHLFGSLLVASALRQPLWYGPALVGLILSPHLLSLLIQAIIHRHNLQSLLSNLTLTSLAPLFVVYLVTAARLAVALSVQSVTGDGSAGVIEPWSSILNLLLWIIVMAVYALAISFYHAAQPVAQNEQVARHPIVNQVIDRRFVQIAAVALVVGAAAWASWNALTLHTYGVSGSDPYAYAQMGVDLAQHGTVFHQFPLIRLTYDLNIPSEPIIHIGYKLPQDVQRIATTVWPPGYAVFTALGYLLAGEQGLYLITPLLSLLSFAVIWELSHTMLGREVAPPRSDPADMAQALEDGLAQRILATPAIHRERNSVGSQQAPSRSLPTQSTEGGLAFAVAALAVALTATSYQQVEWQLIPMADIAAQLFSLLAVALAMRAGYAAIAVTTHSVAQRLTGVAQRTLIRRLALAALSGIALGIAFDVRYTQVLIAPALLFVLLSGARSAPTAIENARIPHQPGHSLLDWVRRHALTVFAFGAGAFAAALPVLIYHTLAFGSPFSTGSEEFANFSLARLPETLMRITFELASPREFGMLIPLIVIGLIALWQRNRRALTTLILYFAPLFVLHIAYAYLRPRDILSLFPVLSFLAAFGIVWLVLHLLQRPAASPDKSAHYNLRLRLKAYVSRLLPAVAGMLVLVGLSFVLVLRSIDTLALPVTHGFDAFGYLVREQRASFTQLAELTPANAVIGCSLNSGAVDLYAGRLTFRPGKWTGDETVKFVRALRAENTPVYLLEDGAEVIPATESLRSVYTLTEVAHLDMPYYFPGSGSENRQVALYRVEP